MSGARFGSLVGGVFGLVYVLVNSSAAPSGLAWALRVLGVVAFAAVLVAIALAPEPDRSMVVRFAFARDYWLVVAAEVVAIVVGVRIVTGPLGLSDAGVAWVSVVVGTHFFALAVLFEQRFFHLLGLGVVVCGLAALVLAALAVPTVAVALVGGVVPGFLLLGTALWGVTRRVPVGSAA